MLIDDVSGGREVLRAAAVCYTDEGEKNALRAGGLDVFRYGRDFDRTGRLMERFFGGMKDSGEGYAVIVFFSAAGIAVRSIAPYIVNKTADPAVIVVNDRADFVIPVLSGHIGRANDASRELASVLGAEAVVTTASDSAENTEAADVFASREGYSIDSMEDAKKVTAALVAGEKTEKSREPDGTLVWRVQGKSGASVRMKPKRYVLGLGCRKGTSAQAMTDFVKENLAAMGAVPGDVYKVCSAEIKAGEKCMSAAASAAGAPFVVFTAEHLNGIPGVFSDSEFVKKVAGTGNVCERSAIAGCGSAGGRIIVKKTARDGMTFAAAERNLL
ncbi:MAG: cobalt-precorrin 5A hydrolase [Anaerovoracaceae bacterium]|jgi:cobalt-precorrin 5A hydrolase